MKLFLNRTAIKQNPPFFAGVQGLRRTSKPVVALLVTSAIAFGGTVSPQLAAMQANQPVQVIVQHTTSLGGSLLSTVCGVTELLGLLPTGELCSTTVADAMKMAGNPGVAHVSVNNILQGTGTGLPVYDYTPQTLQPSSTAAVSANPTLGKNIGVAIIDSGIHVNQDLIGNGSGDSSEASSPMSFMPKALFRQRAWTITTATALTLPE